MGIVRQNTKFSFDSAFGSKNKNSSLQKTGSGEYLPCNKKELYQLIYSLLVGDIERMLPVIHLLGIETSLAGDILVLVNKDLQHVVCSTIHNEKKEKVMEAFSSADGNLLASNTY